MKKLTFTLFAQNLNFPSLFEYFSTAFLFLFNLHYCLNIL